MDDFKTHHDVGSSNDRNIIKLIKWIDKYPLLPIFGSGNHLQQAVFVKDIAWSVVEIIDNQRNIFERFQFIRQLIQLLIKI